MTDLPDNHADYLAAGGIPHDGGPSPDLCGVGRMKAPVKPPAALDAIADKVLRYRPKPVSVAGKKRKKRAKKAKADATG